MNIIDGLDIVNMINSQKIIMKSKINGLVHIY
jgi:hypothetical protein